MVPHYQVPYMFQTKDISLLEVVLGLLQPLHTVLDLWIPLRLLNMIPNDSYYPKTFVVTSKSSL